MPVVAPAPKWLQVVGGTLRPLGKRAVAIVTALCALVCALLPAQARAQATPANLLNIIQAAPEGEWRRVNLNSFSDVWTPSALRPIGAPYPSSIIEAWSSFAWDSTRGELWIFGGGHANYSGNDTYRWRASTQLWERASLPSEMVSMNIPNRTDYFQAIDGPDNAPVAAHTYDNNLYLPRIDRFITFGGGGYNHGGPFLKKSSATTVRATGPYLFDPTRADGNKVGGTTGSHVTRNGPFPEIVGGSMWSNRDVPANPQASALFPIGHLNGSTAYAEENGKDVVYIAAMTGWATSPDLYRYVINDVNNPLADTLTRVGSVWNGNPAADQSASAYDPVRKLFVRLGNARVPIVYWNLGGAVGPGNLDIVAAPVVQGGTFDFDEARNFGLDYDPRRDAFLAWGGGGTVWELLAPDRTGTGNWLLRKLAQPQQATPPALPASHTGVLGKWKYAPNLDAFIALEGFSAGNIWVYKPFGWQDPRGNNQPPTVTLTSPGNGASFTAPAGITLAANAGDADGAVSKVEFFAGATLLATLTNPPYTFAWNSVPAGSYVLTARATDNQNAVTTSNGVSIVVSAPNVPPTVSLTSPGNNASFAAPASINLNATAADVDGAVIKVEFFSGTTLLHTATAAPYGYSWTNVSAGSYVLTARATDSLGAATTSVPVAVTVGPANAPPAVAITSPIAGMSFNAPAAVNITASAADSDGTISKVEFFAGTTLLGAVTTTPYNFAWPNVAPGSYVLTARATDNLGATTTSAPVGITVVAPNVAPTVSMVSPANGATFVAPATIAMSASAADSDGTIAKVEFFAGPTLIASVISAPYSFTWTNVPAGIYALSARATDDRGATTSSSSVTATVSAANALPAVTLTSPSNGASFSAPATVALSATAADGDGTIARVEFLAGSTVLATVTTPPYTYNWTNVAAGNYTLRARATDNQNASTTSAPVGIAVNAVAPTAPAALAASAISRTGVTLSWTDSSNNETQFRVQRSTNGRNFSRIATVDANVTSYVVTGLTPNRTYYFRIVATNPVGSSVPSNVVQITTLP